VRGGLATADNGWNRSESRRETFDLNYVFIAGPYDEFDMEPAFDSKEKKCNLQ